MRPPFERRDARLATRHHLLHEKPEWHARSKSQQVSLLGSYVVGIIRAPHDYLHTTIKPVPVPGPRVLDTMMDLGKEYSGWSNDQRRIGAIVDEMVHFAETARSPHIADEALTVATSLAGQMAIVEFFNRRNFR
jgi:hypothetical protein